MEKVCKDCSTILKTRDEKLKRVKYYIRELSTHKYGADDKEKALALLDSLLASSNDERGGK